MLEMKDIRAMDEKALNAKVQSLKLELFQMKMQAQTSGYQKPHTKKLMKKEIARIMTAQSDAKKNK